MNPEDSRVDQALLGQAQKVLGTASARDTLDLALSIAITQAGRSQAVAAERARFRSGRYSGLATHRAAGAGPGGASASRPAPAPPPELLARPAHPALPAPDAGCLIDTSALAASAQPQAGALLHTLLEAGAAVTCPVLDLEVLATARSAAEHDELATDRRRAYRSVPLTPGTGARMLDLGQLLSRRAHRSALTPSDLLVAAAALEHGLRLVHHSPAFGLLAELTPLDHLDLAAVTGAGDPR